MNSLRPKLKVVWQKLQSLGLFIEYGVNENVSIKVGTANVISCNFSRRGNFVIILYSKKRKKLLYLATLITLYGCLTTINYYVLGITSFMSYGNLYIVARNIDHMIHFSHHSGKFMKQVGTYYV